MWGGFAWGAGAWASQPEYFAHPSGSGVVIGFDSSGNLAVGDDRAGEGIVRGGHTAIGFVIGEDVNG